MGLLGVLWWPSMVSPGKTWDYNGRFGSDYDSFTAANYGATGSAQGYSATLLINVAGIDQVVSDTEKHEDDYGEGVPFFSAPFGETRKDLAWELIGILYFHLDYRPGGQSCQ